MAAYLVVDVDDLLNHFQARNMSVDLQELAVGLRGGATLAAGLVSADKLKAIAVANWANYDMLSQGIRPQTIFKAAGYEVFDAPTRDSIADILIIHYFSYDTDPIDELILATTSRDLLPLIKRIKVTRSARIRMWGSEDVLQGTEFADEIIFQPLETLLGIQSKNVAVYIDFENIAISLNEQGFVVNLDHLIARLVSQAKAYGVVVKMAAYAPWGQRGTLPPLVDDNGREIADEAPSRMMMANIDPVFHLPGKNSADVRIARDVLTDAGHPESGDVYILVSGDRDFNEVINAIAQRGKTVIVWGVRGSTSRLLEKNPLVTVDYIDDFTDLQTHQSLSQSTVGGDDAEMFIPSQWSSVVIQFNRLSMRMETDAVPTKRLIEQLVVVGDVVSLERGEDLISQALSLGVLKLVSNSIVTINEDHPIVEKTLAITNVIRRRVSNTLKVRGWRYVNYGFLLNGLEMEPELNRPSFGKSDQWRSHWIDGLVREQVLERELLPHRQNPDDLVPVIRLPDEDDWVDHDDLIPDLDIDDWEEVSLDELQQHDAITGAMVLRVVVSVEQFTSFRNFAWCPLGSLHKRLRDFDPGMSFQRAVEYLEAKGVVTVHEYQNPQSEYRTKGISVEQTAPLAQNILGTRDAFVRALLQLYEQNVTITAEQIHAVAGQDDWDYELWISIMQTENILNPLQGRKHQYSLFRTHHTVKLVAGDAMTE
jgi:hypothetical protein